jgi:branched-chain amino acid aminotransferase
MEPQPIIYLDGKWLPAEEAKISVLSVTVKYGLNVFEGIRGYLGSDNKIIALFRLSEHLKRLERSMRMMGYADIPSVETLEQIVKDTVTRNEPKTDVHIRLSAYILADGFMDSAGPTGLMCAVASASSKLAESRVITAGVSSWRRITDESLPPRIKNGANYANGRIALMEARRHGYDEAIMLTSEGKVSEAAAACLFLVRDGQLITPSINQSILESVTRNTLIQLAMEICGKPVIEREIDRTELWCAAEAFICGSSYEVTPIRRIDHMEMTDGAPGPISRGLSDTYMKAVRGELTNHLDWLTPVCVAETC